MTDTGLTNSNIFRLIYLFRSKSPVIACRRSLVPVQSPFISRHLLRALMKGANGAVRDYHFESNIAFSLHVVV